MNVRKKVVLFVALTLLSLPVSTNAQDPYGITIPDTTDLANTVPEVRAIEERAASLLRYLPLVRGLPARASQRYLGSYYLLGNRLYTFASTSQDTFDVACEDILVFKVDHNASAKPFVNVTCDGDMMTIRNTDGTGTFILFEPL